MLRLGGRLSWAVLWLLLATLVLTGTVRAAIQGNSWFPIGPAPGTGLSKDHPGSWSGRATVVAMNPAQSFDLWIGTAGGGVWHSTDGAATWKPTSDDEKSLAIGALALADCDGNGCLHVYAGTGENAIRRDTTYGRGLLVGTVSNFNSTVTWQLRTGCTYPFTPCYNFTGGSINNVLLDPRTSGERRVIYITLSSGVTASASESTVTAPEPSPGGYGIYKSSDNGLTWAKLAIPGSEGFRPSDLKMDPTNPDTLYAGFLERGIFRTTNKGATWCPLNPGIPKPQGQGCPQTSGLPAPTLPPSFDHIQMVIDPDDSQHLYATFGRCPDRLLDDCTPSVVETFDGGLQWNLNYPGSTAPMEDLDCPATYSRYMHGLTLWPNHPETLFLSGFHLCKSTDHGTTWSPSDYDTVGFNYHTGLRHTHPDHHMVIFDQTGALAYEVSDGGIATSTDGGTFWTPRNLTLQTTEFQSLAVSPQTPRVIGGTQDNDGLMWLGGKQWEGLSCCGDGGFSVMDKLDKGKMYLTSNATDLLENFSVIPERSWNGGKNFDPASYLIPWNEPRSFYPPLIQDTFHFPAPLYFGTQALYKSTDNALGWSQVSPYLSTDPEPEIHWGEDAITAIAVAPSDPNRIYLGYYSGKVFATDVGGCDPFTDPSCWYESDFLLPRAPITSLAVDPTDKDVVYATLSGFFPGSHVYYHSSLAFAWFPTGSLAELNGVPANWITVEPGARNILWLGTDKGVYKSNAFGKSWFRFSQGLPNVPVYQIAIDQDRQRVFAATHGRGAYMITGPLLSNYEGCVNGYVWSAPVYGNGFDPGHFPCDLRLLRQDGTVCAASPVDAAGGTAWSDPSGSLVTSKNGYWSASPTVWACLNGKCVGGVSVNSCNPPNNPLTTVVAICGPSIGIAHLSGCPNLFNPPSSWFSLTGTSGGFFASGTEANLNACAEPSARTPPGMSRESPLTGGGTFQLLPAVQSGDGTSRRLCSVNVPYSGTDTGSMVLQNASDAVNLDPTCQSAGVSAEFRPAVVEAEPEYQFPHPGNLVLHGAAVAGQQLVPSLRVGPGQADGLCFDFAKLGVPVEGQVGALRVQFATAPAGAQGGSLSLTETSSLGDCSITVPTAAGDSAMRIAGAFETAFQASGLAGPNPGCPSEANPHDMQLKGEALVSAMASSLEICLNDPGVGVSSAPAEICFTDADCEDGNPCTHNSCDPATGRCQAAPEPDGLPCDDGDAYPRECLRLWNLRHAALVQRRECLYHRYLRPRHGRVHQYPGPVRRRQPLHVRLLQRRHRAMPLFPHGRHRLRRREPVYHGRYLRPGSGLGQNLLPGDRSLPGRRRLHRGCLRPGDRRVPQPADPVRRRQPVHRRFLRGRRLQQLADDRYAL